MSISKRLITLLLVVTSTTALFAQVARQSFNRQSFWTETVVNGAITGKFKWQVDLQYRRMSDASNALNPSGNIFKNAYQHVYRPWLNYQLNDNVRLSLSPIGFWETFTPEAEVSTHVRKMQPEFRVCPQITLTNKFGRLTIDQRYRYEQRYVGTNVVDSKHSEFGYNAGMDFPAGGKKGRMRYMVRATLPLGNHQKLEDKTFYLIAWNELFIGTGSQTITEKIWDQNRTFCLLGYKPKMSVPMRFELGYGFQFANRYKAGTTPVNMVENNNILQVYVIFENFNKIFSAKK
jgi:hypothetical protein